MSFTQTKLSYYHTFTKLPVEDGLPLGSAINKAGHTVSATEVWTREIPYFGKMGSKDDITAKVTPYAKKNDMVQITSGADSGKIFQRNGIAKEGKTFAELWVEITSQFEVDGAKFKNADDEEVIQYHKSKKLELLGEANNANINSKNNASRLWVGEGTTRRLVDQFVGVTDRSLNGLASVAYAPIIKKGTADQVAGTDYFDYCVSGTILWNSANTTDSYISCFEYIGPKASVSIKNLEKALSTVEGTLKNGVVSAIDLSEEASNAGFSVNDDDPTQPIIGIELGSVTNGSKGLVTGGDVWNYITELHKIPQLRIIIVENPNESDWTQTEGLTIEKNTIYLVKSKASNSALAGAYIEYIAYEKDDKSIATEQIGTTEVNLENYAKLSDVATKVGEVEWFGENDLISSTATVEDGVLKIVEKEITWERPFDNSPWNATVTKLVNNEAFAGDTKIATVETSKIKDGSFMFYHTNLSEYSSDLSSLETGKYMFEASLIKTFCHDLSSLTEGGAMFQKCNKLSSFIGDLSSLTRSVDMFRYCQKFSSFIGDLNSLKDGRSMFYQCEILTEFNSDLSSLTDGRDMFYGTSLAEFDSDLSSLTNGDNMFGETNLSLKSVECIAETIPTIDTMSTLTITWNPQLTEDKRQSFVDILSRIVDKGWTLLTDSELLPLFDSEKYQTGSSTVKPRDIDSESQTVYYVVKK